MFPSSPEASEEPPAVYREQRLQSEAPSLPVIVSALICLLSAANAPCWGPEQRCYPQNTGRGKTSTNACRKGYRKELPWWGLPVTRTSRREQWKGCGWGQTPKLSGY